MSIDGPFAQVLVVHFSQAGLTGVPFWKMKGDKEVSREQMARRLSGRLFSEQFVRQQWAHSHGHENASIPRHLMADAPLIFLGSMRWLFVNSDLQLSLSSQLQHKTLRLFTNIINPLLRIGISSCQLQPNSRKQS